MTVLLSVTTHHAREITRVDTYVVGIITDRVLRVTTGAP